MPICGLPGPFSGDPLICCRRGPQVSLSTQGSWDCVYVSLRLGWDLPWQGEGRFCRHGGVGSGWPLEFPPGSCQQRQPLPLPPSHWETHQLQEPNYSRFGLFPPCCLRHSRR